MLILEFQYSLISEFNCNFISIQDRRNFVRAPPAGVEFEFNYDVSYPVALALMDEDKALENMRFELVPRM